MNMRVSCSLYFFGTIWKRHFFFIYLVEFTCEAFQPLNFVCWQVSFNTNSILPLLISLFKLFLFDSILVDCMFLDICPFLLGCQVCWHIFVHIIISWLICISVVAGFISPISYFVHLVLFFFFSLTMAKGLKIAYFFSKINFLFHWYFLLIFILFTYSQIYIISPLLMTLGFHDSSFSNNFRWLVKMFI